MSFSSPAFIITIVALAMGAWVMTTLIRARHGYPIEDEMGNLVHPLKAGDDEATRTLQAENRQLKDTIDRLEERMKVLERIATDPTRRLEDEIEKLR